MTALLILLFVLIAVTTGVTHYRLNCLENYVRHTSPFLRLLTQISLRYEELIIDASKGPQTFVTGADEGTLARALYIRNGVTLRYGIDYFQEKEGVRFKEPLQVGDTLGVLYVKIGDGA